LQKTINIGIVGLSTTKNTSYFIDDEPQNIVT